MVRIGGDLVNYLTYAVGFCLRQPFVKLRSRGTFLVFSFARFAQN
jgi:hypothetical protein